MVWFKYSRSVVQAMVWLKYSRSVGQAMVWFKYSRLDPDGRTSPHDKAIRPCSGRPPPVPPGRLRLEVVCPNEDIATDLRLFGLSGILRGRKVLIVIQFRSRNRPA